MTMEGRTSLGRTKRARRRRLGPPTGGGRHRNTSDDDDGAKSKNVEMLQRFVTASHVPVTTLNLAFVPLEMRDAARVLEGMPGGVADDACGDDVHVDRTDRERSYAAAAPGAGRRGGVRHVLGLGSRRSAAFDPTPAPTASRRIGKIDGAGEG